MFLGTLALRKALHSCNIATLSSVQNGGSSVRRPDVWINLDGIDPNLYVDCFQPLKLNLGCHHFKGHGWESAQLIYRNVLRYVQILVFVVRRTFL